MWRLLALLRINHGRLPTTNNENMYHMPFVVSLSNHEPPFDRFRANRLNSIFITMTGELLNQIINLPQLTIPHPHLEERAFVLVPLAELAPELVHPVSHRKVRELVKRVEGLAGVEKWKQGEEKCMLCIHQLVLLSLAVFA